MAERIRIAMIAKIIFFESGFIGWVVTNSKG